MYLLYILQFCCFSINWKWVTVGLGHVFTSKPNKHRHMIKSGVWSVPNFVVSVVLGKRMSEKVIRHPLIKFRIWKLLPALTGTLLQQLESWNQNVFVETQSANRCEPKTRAVESSGVRAIIITATVQHSERILHRQPGGRCACVYFFSLYSWDEAEFDFRYSAKTATHTCVAVIWCERQHTCFQFLSSTWQFEIRSGKTISLLGSMKYRIIISLRISGLRLISEHLRRSGSSFIFRFCWKMIFLMESNCFNCKVTEVTRVNSSLLYNKRNTSCLYNLLACLL